MPNVSLTSPPIPGALPPELQTQQMQLQVQQQIAEALMAQGMQGVDPVTHGPAGNPFARDTVNWGGILSKLANALGGRSELNRIGPEQTRLAAAAEDIRKQDMAGVMQDVMGGQTPGPYEGGSIVKKPDMIAAIRRALLSSHPAVQAQGEAMQKALIEAQMKGLATPEVAAAASRNITPESFASSITPQTGGYPLGNTVDVSKWAMKAVPREGPGGAQGTLYPTTGAQVQPAGVVQPPRQPVVNPNETLPGDTTPGAVPPLPGETPPAAPANKTGSTLTYTPEGVPKVLETATTEGGKKSAEDFRKTLNEGKENSLEFIQTAPKLLKALELLPNADMKKGGNLITDARKWAQTMGMSTDNANKIGDTETFLKTMMSPATGAARAFNSRATQLEFVQFLKAFAASQDTDPRAAANIITQMLLDGVNQNTQHLKNIEQAKGIPGLENAAGYQLSNFPTIASLASAMDKTKLKTDLKQDSATGLWSDAMAAKRGQNAYWPTPGPKAIEMLKNGADRNKFDEYFGVGAADAIHPVKE